MSKGNMFLGGARGSVGDVTLSVVKGQQVTKRRNRNPNNPRSKKQMYQRSTFAEPVKFFTRGQQNLFKFAFENKGATESDYNAFMRVNAKLGVLMTREQIENPFIAKFGNFCLTQGSMTGLSAEKLVYVDINDNACVGIKTNMPVGDVPATVGDLSAIILNAFKSMQEGDIITTLQIVADNGYIDDIPYITTDGGFEPVWYINQIILNRNDSTPLASAWSLSKSADGKLIIANADAFGGEEFSGCALILSRNTPSGTKVSTSYIKNSDRVKAVMALMKPNFTEPDFTDPWTSTVLASWSATDEAILQGSLAGKPSTSNVVITRFGGLDIPSIANHSCSPSGQICGHTIVGSGLYGLESEKFTVVSTMGVVTHAIEKRTDTEAALYVYNEGVPYEVGAQGTITVIYDGTLLAAHSVAVQ